MEGEGEKGVGVIWFGVVGKGMVWLDGIVRV